jgi:tetratricopeptide (TPR) repeat protein
MRGFVGEWHEYALACVDREFGVDDLWSVYGLLRGWLHLPERFSEEQRLLAHRAAGEFLNVLRLQDRYGDLGLTWVEVCTEERMQHIEAADYSLAREATDHLSGFLMMRGLYEDVNQLNLNMLKYDEHPGPMIWIGRAYGERGYHQPAIEWFQRALKAAGEKLPKDTATALLNLATEESNVGNQVSARRYAKRSLQIYQDINDPMAEAVCWNHLALFDIEGKDYNAARKKLKKAIRIRQKIGDHLGLAHALTNLAQIDVDEGNDEAARGNLLKTLRITQREGIAMGEAPAFFQLGYMAHRLGRLDEGVRLVALSFLINEGIGHRNAEASFKVLSQMATRIGYTNKLFHAMLNEVRQEYVKDRGWGLLTKAFPER